MARPASPTSLLWAHKLRIEQKKLDTRISTLQESVDGLVARARVLEDQGRSTTDSLGKLSSSLEQSKGICQSRARDSENQQRIAAESYARLASSLQQNKELCQSRAASTETTSLDLEKRLGLVEATKRNDGPKLLMLMKCVLNVFALEELRWKALAQENRSQHDSVPLPTASIEARDITETIGSRGFAGAQRSLSEATTVAEDEETEELMRRERASRNVALENIPSTAQDTVAVLDAFLDRQSVAQRRSSDSRSHISVDDAPRELWRDQPSQTKMSHNKRNPHSMNSRSQNSGLESKTANDGSKVDDILANQPSSRRQTRSQTKAKAKILKEIQEESELSRAQACVQPIEEDVSGEPKRSLELCEDLTKVSGRTLGKRKRK